MAYNSAVKSNEESSCAASAPSSSRGMGRPAVPISKPFQALQKKNETGLPDHLKAGIEAPGGQKRHLPHEAWHVIQQKQERLLSAGSESPGVIQKTGMMAIIFSGLTWATWGSMLATPFGLLSAALLIRQARESYLYHTGLKETERNKILDTQFQVHIRRTQKFNRRTELYQDDHISIGVMANNEYIRQVGFWMDRSDYVDFTFLAFWNKGEVRDDKNKFDSVDMSGDLFIDVTADALKIIMDRIEKDEKAPPHFSSTGYGGYTCVNWAHEVLRSANITIPFNEHFQPINPSALIPDSDMKEKGN